MARALYEKDAPASAPPTFRVVGFNPFINQAPKEPEVVEVFPENEAAYFLLLDMDTQWNIVGGGAGFMAVGLNYLVLFSLMDRMKLEPEEWEILLADIRVMESEARFCLNKTD